MTLTVDAVGGTVTAAATRAMVDGSASPAPWMSHLAGEVVYGQTSCPASYEHSCSTA